MSGSIYIEVVSYHGIVFFFLGPRCTLLGTLQMISTIIIATYLCSRAGHLGLIPTLSVLLDPELEEERICKTQPVNVEHNSTFIVDLSLLDSPKDIYVDDMESWKYNGVYRTWVSIESDGFMITHGKLRPSQDEDDSLYHLEIKYFVHKTSADLKMIAIISVMFTIYH